MKKLETKSMKTVTANAVTKIGKFLNKHSGAIACCLVMAMMIGSFVFAENTPAPDAAGNAEEAWNSVITAVVTWVSRLAVVVVVVGGIMFGLGFRNDDPSQKTNGVSTAIAGGIVWAVVQLLNNVA